MHCRRGVAVKLHLGRLPGLLVPALNQPTRPVPQIGDGRHVGKHGGLVLIGCAVSQSLVSKGDRVPVTVIRELGASQTIGDGFAPTGAPVTVEVINRSAWS